MSDNTALDEAGRKISKKNESKLRAAVDELMSVLSLLDAPDDEDVSEAVQAAIRALSPRIRQLAEADLSHGDMQSLVMAAIRAQFPNRDMWIMDMFDGYAIVCDWGAVNDEGLVIQPRGKVLWRFDYTVGEDNAVTLGTPVEVRLERSYVPVNQQVSESGDVQGAIVPLIERSLRSDGTIPVKIIQSGWGSSGYYPKEVLKRDGPKVFKNGLHMFWNHPTYTESVERPERDLGALAAVLVSDARWEEKGAAGAGLYADAKVFGDYREAIDELAPHIGVSIYASGVATQGEAEGRKGTIIEQLTAAQSVDFVTVPGAGGKVLELFESAGRKAPQGKIITEGVEPMADNKDLQALQAQVQQLTEANARLTEGNLLREAKDVVTGQLAKADLPDITKTRLAESLHKNPPMKDAVLDKEALTARVTEAIDAEVAYLAEAAGYGSGRIVGMGGGNSLEGDGKGLVEAEAKLAEAYGGLGLSNNAAKVAATGR